MEMIEYINDPPRQAQNIRRDSQQTEKRFHHLLLFSFGLLCLIQAILNVSLRLTLHFSTESTASGCNTTQSGDKNQATPHCNELQERFNALTRDRDELQNKVSILKDKIKDVEEQRDRLQFRLDKLVGTVSPPGCATDWREINGRCYFLSSESKSWVESRQYCLDAGADLVVINSIDEQRALYRLNSDQYLLFWIGLKATDGTFRWVDHSALTQTFWQVGQPGDGGPNNVEECVEMYHQNPVLYSWNDAPCGSKRRWLCEKDP